MINKLKIMDRVIALSIRVVLVLSGLVFVVACATDNQYLFYINNPLEEPNDLVFLAESSNVLKVPKDSVSHYLTFREFRESSNLEVKNFQTLKQTDLYQLKVVFISDTTLPHRDYHFYLRTFNLSHEVIDSYEIGLWNQNEDTYCYGNISHDLIIHKTCQDGSKEILQVLKDGRIVHSSFAK